MLVLPAGLYWVEALDDIPEFDPATFSTISFVDYRRDYIEPARELN